MESIKLFFKGLGFGLIAMGMLPFLFIQSIVEMAEWQFVQNDTKVEKTDKQWKDHRY